MKHGFNNNNDNMWDFTVQCDRKIEARRPDIVFIDIKGGEGDDRVKDEDSYKSVIGAFRSVYCHS